MLDLQHVCVIIILYGFFCVVSVKGETDEETVCGSGTFRCDGNKCLPLSWRCDGQQDCLDGTDELSCEDQGCKSGFFRCADNNCISEKWRCDEDIDCADGSDEANCTGKACSDQEFQCKDKTCTFGRWKCDGDQDCPDGSDEDVDVCSDVALHSSCRDKEFQCEPGVCIHESWECDGDTDCTNGADEGSHCKKTCTEDQFICDSSLCLSKTLLCDGNVDCKDGSDEHNCTDNKDGSPPTPQPPTTMTLEPCTGRFVDGECRPICNAGYQWSVTRQECQDVDECGTRNVCSQRCVNIAGSYQCECFTGYRFENRTSCIAEGEQPWLYFSERTSVRRIHTDGSNMELVLDAMVTVFDLDHEAGLLFYIDFVADKVKRLSLSPTINASEALPSSIYDGQEPFTADGIAVDWLYKHVYWTDTGSDVIRVSTYDGVYPRTLIDTDLDEPRSIAVHPEQGYMYWTDWGEDARIERCGLDGNDRQVIVSKDDGLGWPNGIAIDYAKERLYWVDAKLDHIVSSELDGSGITVVLANKDITSHPFSVAVFEDYVYWTDWRGADALMRANKLDGSNHTKITTGDLMDLKVSHAAYQANEFKDTADRLCATAHCEQLCLPKAVVKDNATQAVGCHCIDGYHLSGDSRACVKTTDRPATTATSPVTTYIVTETSPTVSSSTTAPSTTATKTSSNIVTETFPTVPTSSLASSTTASTSVSQSVVSSTPTIGSSTVLTSTAKTRDDNSWWLYFSQKTTLKRVRPDGSKLETVLNNVECIGIDIDFEEGLLFYTDYRADAIQRMSINDSKAEASPVYKGTDKFTADGIAVDWLYKHIYWTDTGIDEIRVATYDGEYARTLINKDLRDPRAIVLYPELGYLYWSDWAKNNAKIERSGMDGNGRQAILTEKDGLATPNGLSIDYLNQRLYWVDARLDKIISSELDGSDIRTIVTNDMTSMPHLYGIAVFDETIYWTDWQTKSLNSINTTTGKISTNLATTNNGLILDVKVSHPLKQSQEFRDEAVSLCAASQCQHLCLPKEFNEQYAIQEVGCYCGNGYRLADDGKMCEQNDIEQSTDKPAENPWLYFARRTDLARVRLDGTSKEVMMYGIWCVGIDIDYEEGIMFCSGVFEDAIYSIPLHGAQMEPTMIYKMDNASTTDGLAVDWLYKHVYWTDGGIGVIKVITYDGQYARTLIDTDIQKPRGIAVYPELGYMYWTDWGYNAKIERSGLDGNNRLVLASVNDGVGWPNGITIDYAENRIYWIDAKSDMITSSALDGSNKAVICQGDEIVHPFSILIHGEYIYWNDWSLGAIRRVNKQTTGDGISTVATLNGNVRGMVVSQAGRQSKAFKETADSLCTTAQCDQLCLPKAVVNLDDKPEVGCYCSEGYRLLDDNKTCVSTSDIPTSTATVSSTSIATAESQTSTVKVSSTSTATSDSPTSTVTLSSTSIATSELQTSTVKLSTSTATSESPTSSSSPSKGPTSSSSVGSVSTTTPTQSPQTSTVLPETTKTSDPCSLKTCPEHSTCRNTHLFSDFVVATCVCGTGFEWDVDQQLCLDMDECQGRGTCSQICVNTVGSFMCDCEAGYTLQEKGFCNADGGSEWFYMTNGLDIRRLHYQSGYEQVIFYGTSNRRSLDYDYGEGRLFFSDVGGIYSAMIPEGLQTIQEYRRILTVEGTVPASVCVDWLFKRVYWIDAVTKRIMSAGYDGDHVRILVDSHLDDPRQIVVDPERGHLYMTDCGASSFIDRIQLDGSNRKPVRLRADGLQCADAITIDYVDKRLYWIDDKRHVIESTNLDGSDYSIVVMDTRTIKRPRSVAVFEDTVFWIDGTSNSLLSVNKRTSQMNRPRALRANHVTDIKVYQAMKQRDDLADHFKSLCNEAQCEVCAPVPRGDFGTASNVTCS